MGIYQFEITGVSPILQNNPAKMQKKADGGLKGGKKVYDPAIEAEESSYRNERGELVVPSIAFRASMFKACTGRKIGKMGAKSVVAASVFPVEMACILLGQKSGKPLTKFEIHSTRVVIQRQGIIRCRAMIADWKTILALEVDSEMLPDPNVVEQLLNVAGKVAGIMDWRPERLGMFGRYTAKLVK